MASNLSSDDRRELEALREDVAYLKQRVEAIESDIADAKSKLSPSEAVTFNSTPASESTGDAEPTST